jgi:pimeloyl-ACP methyl ester carboxylesterase
MATPSLSVDYVETGTGPSVILLHSSVAGNRQWRSTVEALQDHYHAIAINFFGYGQTSPWSGGREQTLADQAELVLPFIDRADGDVAVVGHSFGGAVAMTVALHRPGKVKDLILLEPIPFRLLDDAGREDAYAEVISVRDMVRRCGGSGDWETAAACFADYWNGEGTWAAMTPERRKTFASAMPSNCHEWDAVLGRGARLEWADIHARTLVAWTRDTKRPTRQIVEVLRGMVPFWQYQELVQGGHMFPLTRPDMTNRLICDFLDAGREVTGQHPGMSISLKEPYRLVRRRAQEQPQ